MKEAELNRREFLRAAAAAAIGIAASSCAQPTPQVIEKPVTVVVEKEVPVEKQVLTTVIVEKEVPVERVVQQTVVVEKEVAKVVKETVVVEKEKQVERIVTATPVVMKYNEAPMLAGLVAQGKLPPVDDRLPANPMVITPWEETGQYGGTWHRLGTSIVDILLSNRLTYECPVRYKIDASEIIPNVAESWEVASGGKVFTFKLRKGMKWSDGEPYTADDILFYYEDILLNKDLSPSFPAWLMTGADPGKIEKVDDYTIRFSFTQPHGIFMYLIAAANGLSPMRYPKHFMQQFHPNYTAQSDLDNAVKAAGYEFWYQLFNNVANVEGSAEVPVIHAWKLTVPPPKQPVVAERNAYYWKVDTAGNQLPYIDRIEYMFIEGAEAVNLRAIAGETDMQVRHISFNNYPLYMENAQKGDYRIILWEQGKPTDTCIYPNLLHQDPISREIIADKRFRWAFSLGIKRDEVIDAVYLGMAEPRQLAPLPTSPFYLESQAQNLLEYDPDRANQLLDEMGLTERDSEGYRLRPDGKRLSLLFEHADHFATWNPIGELLTEHMKVLGIEMTNKEYARQLFMQHVTANEHDIACWNGTSAFNPLIDPRSWIPFRSGSSLQAVPYARWYETGGKEGEEPTGDLRKVLDLFDQIMVTPDESEQVKLFHQILELNQEHLWTVGISTDAPQPLVAKNSFRNVPEEAVNDWQLLTPGNTIVEQYYIRQS